MPSTLGVGFKGATIRIRSRMQPFFCYLNWMQKDENDVFKFLASIALMNSNLCALVECESEGGINKKSKKYVNKNIRCNILVVG